MFTLFRYGLIPVVLFCIVIITGGVHTVSTNSLRKSTWPQTVVTVVQSQDFNQALAEFRGTQNAFPTPTGRSDTSSVERPIPGKGEVATSA
jgi:hypothetical protein